ncbi:MAG: ATP-binding cassette domain-containing protein [Candidatus Methylomirabilis sp.]|nr:ATP-binding cassette domain-containing protein [Candidatus Methylomirabilis sp.]
MNDPILRLDTIKVTYDGRVVLDVPSLDIPEGETLAVIGPNGAGKSTLLRILGLLEQPTEGCVVFAGRSIRPYHNLLSDRRRMASVFQEPLLTDGTVEANVALGLRLRRVDAAEVNRRVADGMATFNIGHLARRRTRTLSGGEAQRVSLARAMVLDPEVFLLDEPFAALDAPTREALLLDLKTILDKRRITTIFVTHDRNEALVLGDRVGVMMGGRCFRSAPPSGSLPSRSTSRLPGSSVLRRSFAAMYSA